MSYSHADMPLDNQGLVLIRGENLDEGGSNGAGKSTPFELLYNLFYDRLTKTERKIKKSDLLNVYHPKDFLVRLDLESDGIPYQVDKFRAHSKRGTGMSLLKSGVNITPDDPRDAQRAVSKLIGLSPNEYLGRVYLSQRHTHMMIDGTPAQKKEYLSRCFGWDTLDVIVKETTKRLNSIPLPDERHLKAILEGVEQDLQALGNLPDLESQLDLHAKKQSELQLKLVELKVELAGQETARETEEERKGWAKVVASKFSLELELSSLKETLQKKKKLLLSMKEALANAKKRVSLESRLSDEGATEDLPEDSESRLETISRKLSRLERDLPGAERKDRLHKQLQQLPDVEEDIETTQARATKWKLKLEAVQEPMFAAQAELRKLKDVVGDVCYTCLRPINSHEKNEMLREREETLSNLGPLAQKAQEALDYYSSNLTTLTKRADLLAQVRGLPEESVSSLQENIDSLRNEQTRIQKLSAKIARIQSLREQLKELPELDGHVEDLEALLASQEAKTELLEDAYQWVLKNGDTKFDVHALQRTQGSVKSYSGQLEDLNQKLLSAQEKLTKYKTLQKQKDDLNKSLNTASAEKTRHRVLRYLTVTIDELKRLSLRESTQLLSNVLPLYLNQLFPDGSIQLGVTDDSDGFDLMFNKGGKSIPLTLISGGQAKRVGIAIVFAFAKMGRNTTNLLICDEPFRDLDQKGRGACFELLRDFDMGTILVTSHDQDMNTPKKYDQVWTVQMSNNNSRLLLNG